MPKLSDAERRRIAREKAKQLAETPQPRISSQKAAQSQAQSQSQTQRQPQKQLSQSQKQLSQSSGASAGGSNRGPLWARFPRLLCLSFPCLFLLAFAGYVIWTSFKASPARSRPEAGPATSAASSVAAGATASVDKGPTGPKILPSSLTPRQLFGVSPSSTSQPRHPSYCLAPLSLLACPCHRRHVCICHCTWPLSPLYTRHWKLTSMELGS